MSHNIFYEAQHKGEIHMVKNNRTNEDDLREAIKEKARLAQEETARMKVRESENDERHGVKKDS